MKKAHAKSPERRAFHVEIAHPDFIAADGVMFTVVGNIDDHLKLSDDLRDLGYRMLWWPTHIDDHLLTEMATFLDRHGAFFDLVKTPLDKLVITRPVVDMGRKKRPDAVWVKPELVAEFEFRAWTTDGKLRHPSYKGLRDAADASGVFEIE